MQKNSNMLNNSLISFCVPTYNRPDTLMVAISSIIKQEAKYNYEIVISDNSETDETAKIMEGYKDNPKIRYYKNPSNIGSAANFAKVIDLAEGKYVWLMGDDDALTDGALSRAVSLLDKEPGLNYIFASRSLCNRDLKPLPGYLQPKGLHEDVIFKSGKDFFAALNGQMPGLIGYISSTIIKKEIWDKSFTLVGKPLGNWSHARVILDAIKDVSCAVLAGENVLTRLLPSEDSINSNIWIDQGVELLKLAERWEYDRDFCRLLIGECFHDYAKMFVIDKALGKRTGSLFDLSKHLECESYIKINWIWFLMSILPGSFLAPLLWIKKIRRKQ